MTATDSSHHSELTIDGRFVRAFVDGVLETCGYFEERARRILASHGIDDPEPGVSYPLGAYLDALEEVQRTTGPNTLNRIGRATPAALQWSPGVRTIEDAFENLDRALDRAHDGSGAGEFTFRATDDGGLLVADSPYPDAFERGLVEGIGKHFGTDTGFIAIADAGSHPADGGDAREFDLTWWETRDERKTISPPADRSQPTATADRASAD
jgi:hypothetical protein